MAKPKWLDSLSRTCPACSQSFTISQDTLELRPTGPVEVCPSCKHEIQILGDFAEQAIHIKMHGLPA